MNPIERRLRAVVNPASTAITRWWCQSALRHLLTGRGPSARQRRLIRIHRKPPRGATRAAPRPAARAADPSAETMKARAAAINELLAPHDHQT
jgi:hypothetical protein